jgi:hypothetical protein
LRYGHKSHTNLAAVAKRSEEGDLDAIRNKLNLCRVRQIGNKRFMLITLLCQRMIVRVPIYTFLGPGSTANILLFKRLVLGLYSIYGRKRIGKEGGALMLEVAEYKVF